MIAGRAAEGTQMIYTVHRFETVDSTNSLALSMAGAGAPEGTVVVAGEQTAGRGRHGRPWVSQPGSGLYLSVILRPDMPPGLLWQLGFAASVAAADAISRVAGITPRAKWPNDLLIGGRKVCGILIEACPHAPHASAVIGIGINVNASTFPDEIAPAATSLAIELSRALPLDQVESALLRSLDARYAQLAHEGFETLLASWREIDCTAGRSVSIRTADGMIHGTATGVDSSGVLTVECAGGRVVRVAAGDVMLR